MMPELSKSELHIPATTPRDTPSDPESTAEVRVIRASERPPPPTTASGGQGSVVAVHMSNRPPPPDPGETIPSARRWLEKTQETLHWLPKKVPRGPMGVAIGVGGLVAVVGIVIGIAAAFSGESSEPSAAAAGHSGSPIPVASGVAAPSRPAQVAPLASAASPASAGAPAAVESGGVPVISVDNLPYAPQRGSAAAAPRGTGGSPSSPAPGPARSRSTACRGGSRRS